MLKLLLIGVMALCMLHITSGRRLDEEEMEEELMGFMDSRDIEEVFEDLAENAYAAKCYASAVKATKGLIELNKVVMMQGEGFAKMKVKDVTNDNLVEWAGHMAFFYSQMKKKNPFLKGCSKHFYKNIPKSINRTINAEVQYMLKLVKTEKQLEAMDCKKLALVTTKGILALNHHYYPKAKEFLSMPSGTKPVAAMHKWLRVIGPYWYMIHRKSKAATKCVTDNDDEGAACLVKAKKAASDLVTLNEKYIKNPKKLSDWAYDMTQYYMNLKKEDASLKACTAMFAFTAPPRVRKAIKAALAKIKKYETKEKDLAAMKCADLAKKVTKGLIALNKIYMPLAKAFSEKTYTTAADGMHEWVQHIIPYWKTINGKSPAVTACVVKNYPTM